MVSEICIRIINCGQCPYCLVEDDRAEDAFEMPFKYVCRATAAKKVIKSYVTHPSDGPRDHEIPDWCPFS